MQYRYALLRGALLLALLGCGSSSGGGSGGGGGGGMTGTAGASNSGGTSGAPGSAGQGAAAGNAGAGGTGAAGSAGTAAAGATGAGGSSAAAPLTAGTYAGTATGADCVGFPSGTGCSVQITLIGSGPTYKVAEFMLPGGISGSGVTVTQTGGNLTVDLLTDSTADFCPATEYTGSGTVGAGGASMSVVLSGPPCESSDTVFISVALTKQ
jgi:hypothetical protein